MEPLFAGSSFGFGLVQGVTALAVISAIVTGIVAIRKLGPERDSLFMTNAQTAAVIMDNLISTLRGEVEREQKENRELAAEVRRLTEANLRLEHENEGLRRDASERSGDIPTD